MDPTTALIGFLQALIIFGGGFAVKLSWSNSIVLARIETKLSTVCDRVEDHEERIREIAA